MARGTLVNGNVIFACWGRCDMGQVVVADTSSTSTTSSSSPPMKCISRPRLLLLPTADIRHVWCGSEFSIAAGGDGLLWSCGWNEHDNVQVITADAKEDVHTVHTVHTSDGTKVKSEKRTDYYDEWVPIVCGDGKRVKLSTPWQHSLAVGGAHSLALVQYGDVERQREEKSEK